jgi:hypothetical protein
MEEQSLAILESEKQIYMQITSEMDKINKPVLPLSVIMHKDCLINKRTVRMRGVWQIREMQAPQRIKTRYFGIFPTVVETGTPQVHEEWLTLQYT